MRKTGHDLKFHNIVYVFTYACKNLANIIIESEDNWHIVNNPYNTANTAKCTELKWE